MQMRRLHERISEIPAFDESILEPEGEEVVRAVFTMPLQEFKFGEYCRKQGLATYIPVRRAWKIHNVSRNGRSYSYSKEVLRPLFASYVFVKVALSEMGGLYSSNMINRILPVNDLRRFIDEIRVVRKVEVLGFSQELELNSEIAVGEHFTIQSGIWEGVNGWLSRKDGVFKWTVQIEIANQYVTTTIDPTQFKMTRFED